MSNHREPSSYSSSISFPLEKTIASEDIRERIVKEEKLFWWEPGNFWVVTSYELAKIVFSSEDYSNERMPYFFAALSETDINFSSIEDYLKLNSIAMINSDGTEHKNRRRLCYHGLTTQSINQLEPFLEKLIEGCLVNFTGKAPYDFVKELAQIIPFATTAELLAIPENDRAELYDWSVVLTTFFSAGNKSNSAEGKKANLVVNNLFEYFTDLIQQRHKNIGQDFLSGTLLHQDKFGLDDKDLISQIIMILAAGHITTTHQMSNALYCFLTTPGLWSKLQENLPHLDSYIEECTRLYPAIPFVLRLTKNDTILNDKKISKGSFVYISVNDANCDPVYFPNPKEINIQTNHNTHLSFGYGSHFCFGAKLSRIEMYVLFKVLLERFPALKISTQIPSVKIPYNLLLSGFKHIYLEK